MFKRLLISVMLLLPVCAQATDTLRFSGGAAFDSHHPSVIIPLLTEAFRRIGVNFETVHLPSRRSTVSANSGLTDGELHRVGNFHEVTNHQFKNLIRIDSVLMVVSVSIFAHKSSDIAALEDVSTMTVAHRSGRRTIESLLKTVDNVRVVHVLGDEQAFDMLASGRVDAVISDTVSGNYFVRKNPLLGDFGAAAMIYDVPIYAYINARHSALLDRIVASLEGMKEDGSFERIYGAAEARFLNSSNGNSTD